MSIPCLDELILYLKDYCHDRMGYFENRLISTIPKEESTLQKAVSYYFVNKGKRVRPLLTLLSCEVVGGYFDDAIEAACAVELIHASSLIFDDLPCMDNAETRRGKLTMHKRFGEAVAVLTAIYFLNKSYEIALNLGEYSNRIIQTFTEYIGEKGMVIGQIMDIEQNGNYKTVNKLKTGSLIKLAVLSGACMGDVTKAEERVLINYAEKVGIVYQLRDDVIDGKIPKASQQEANALAYQAAQEICSAFDNSKAAYALAGMALYAVNRDI